MQVGVRAKHSLVEAREANIGVAVVLGVDSRSKRIRVGRLEISASSNSRSAPGQCAVDDHDLDREAVQHRLYAVSRVLAGFDRADQDPQSGRLHSFQLSIPAAPMFKP